MPLRYPVLNQIAENDRKKCIESQLCPDGRRRTTPIQRSEFVHATVEDDLIGPGHIRSRSRSRTRPGEAGRYSGQQRSSSKPGHSSSTGVRPGLEIHLPQRGRYIVVEDVRHAKKRSKTPEFVLVNKENGRAIPLHSLYHNPLQRGTTRLLTTPTDPPVDYNFNYNNNNNNNNYNKKYHQGRSRQTDQDRMRKARSMSDLSEDGFNYNNRPSPVHSMASFESSRQSSVPYISKNANMCMRVPHFLLLIFSCC